MESNSLCFRIQCHSSRIGGGQKYAVKAGWPQGWQKKDINSWNCWVKRKLLCSIQKAVGRFAKHTKRIKEQHSVQGHVKSKEKSACYVIVQMDFFRKVFKFRSRRSEESILQTDYGHPLPCRNVFSSMRMQVILLTGQLWLFWMNFYSARQLFSHLWEDS